MKQIRNTLRHLVKPEDDIGLHIMMCTHVPNFAKLKILTVYCILMDEDQEAYSSPIFAPRCPTALHQNLGNEAKLDLLLGSSSKYLNCAYIWTASGESFEMSVRARYWSSGRWVKG
jgi:hypothetical protein